MTGNQVWLDVAIDLYKKGIAQPVLWLGDDRHYKKAQEAFGDSVVRMLYFVHRPYRLNEVFYGGENIGFFSSENYLRAKDKCLRMMDRLDLYGVFSRQDREVYFNKLIIWTLKKLEDERPDALIVAEMPHSHAQYLIYEICLYLGIRIAKFNIWTPAPLLYLHDLTDDQRIEANFKIEEGLGTTIEKALADYVSGISKLNEKSERYEPGYMKRQRLKSQWSNKAKELITKGVPAELKVIKHQIGMILRGEYNPINPYHVGILGRAKIKYFRKKNLFNCYQKMVDKCDYSKKYVYFPLHFEPERTTNPDGGRFHDQSVALASLRKLLPNDVEIFVKEHPSQFYFSDKGSRGRSPLFYNLIKNIRGVRLISINEDSIKLVKHAQFSATITGTVAMEAAIMGKKSLTFGDTWYEGCPNIMSWNDALTYESIIGSHVEDSQSILGFLYSKMKLHCVPGRQNVSSETTYARFINENFSRVEIQGVSHLLQEFFKRV